MSLVIAPDSFKGSLAAAAAAAAIAEGWSEVRPADSIALLPQADGGEGTLNAIESAIPDAVRHRVERVTGPAGQPTSATWLSLPDGSAVVELAESSGLPLMSAPDALGATTRGLGQVIRAALETGASSLVIALGGSASTDGAAGALQALGMRMLRADGSDIGSGGVGLATLRSIDTAQLTSPPSGGVVLLTDVDAPLLGARGAAAAFGPQKGATPAEVAQLEQGLALLAELLGGDPAEPGSGAAGGTAYGFSAVWGATTRPGAAWVAKLTGLTAAVQAADVVITGEGRFDSTSLGGKVVGNVLAMTGAGRVGIVAGSVAAPPPAGAWALSLTDLAGSAEVAMADPERWLREAGREAAMRFG
jgi:glycerate kinase